MFLITFSGEKTVELPIVPKFEENFLRANDKNIEEKIRILDIDGVYMVSRITIERSTRSFVQRSEVAFDSLKEAKSYLNDQFGLSFSEDEVQEDWRDYDYY
jgi:hypothetical protein